MYKNFVFDVYGTLVDIHTNEHEEKTWEKMARAALEKGKKMISIYFGSDSNEDEAEKCANVFRKIIKNATVDIFDGGQPVYSFLISAEA